MTPEEKPTKTPAPAREAKPAEPAKGAKPATKAAKAPAAKESKAAKPGKPAAKAPKAPKPERKPARAPPATRTPIDPHSILIHPMVTEKTMRLMDENNSLEFLVRRGADKAQIKAAVEGLFSAQVETVNTRITKDGKRAIVKFGGETTAEDIGMRIGVF